MTDGHVRESNQCIIYPSSLAASRKLVTEPIPVEVVLFPWVHAVAS